MKGKTMTNVTETRTAAESTDCGFSNCSGNGHDDCAPKSDWSHDLYSEKFDDGLVTTGILVRDGAALGAVDLSGYYTDAPADELRAAAEKYEAFPALLRSMADQIDAFNAANKTVES